MMSESARARPQFLAAIWNLKSERINVHVIIETWNAKTTKMN